MRVTVIGTGYVGLITGCGFSALGHDVICVDNNKDKIDLLLSGISPIYEAGLEPLIQDGIKAARLHFTTDLEQAVKHAGIIFLALPTPSAANGSADLSATMEVVKKLSQTELTQHCLVINKSTSPVGTVAQIEKIFNGSSKLIQVASNPEFLREGRAVYDFMTPERIAIGVRTNKAEKVLRKLYQPLIDKNIPLYVTSPETAELSKYVANAFLATKVNFMNEVAELCETMDADVDSLREIIGADTRIGTKFLYPGIGAGGSCFPKDVRALAHMAKHHKIDFKLLNASMQVSEQQHTVLLKKIAKHFGEGLNGKTVAYWGLAFKPDTDDIRESPAVRLLDELIDQKCKIIAYDPQANDNARVYYKDNKNVKIVDNMYDVFPADALVIGTDWNHFKVADLDKLKQLLSTALIFDGRNIFSTAKMSQSGFKYYSIGRQATP